jgi:hypothetical protein
VTTSHSNCKSRGTKPQKPCPDCPLYAHRSGKWAVKILGRSQYYSGRWDDPAGALSVAPRCCRVCGYYAGNVAIHIGTEVHVSSNKELVMKKATAQVTRRSFMKRAGAAATVTLAAPAIVPSHVLGANPPSETVTIGMLPRRFPLGTLCRKMASPRPVTFNPLSWAADSRLAVMTILKAELRGGGKKSWATRA